MLFGHVAATPLFVGSFGQQFRVAGVRNFGAVFVNPQRRRSIMILEKAMLIAITGCLMSVAASSQNDFRSSESPPSAS
jgi:hypothetical protein